VVDGTASGDERIMTTTSFAGATDADARIGVNADATTGPRGPKPKRISPGRIGIYCFLIIVALFFCVPLYVMIVTSLKAMPEVREGHIFNLPHDPTIEPWIKAWSSACTGRDCTGLSPGFLNSVKIAIPAVIISIVVASLNGYALTFWRYKGAEVLFNLLVFGAFVPYQVLIYPIIIGLRDVHLFATLPGIIIVHTIFGMPILTLLFRNYYASVPIEIFKAARIDGAGFWQTYLQVMLPLSVPITTVAVILQVTGIWNDFLFGLVFAGKANIPMTLQLNNIVKTTTGTIEYDVNMAATILTALVPLIIYFVSGKWFVRGIAAGAVKG
jgi:glucose/mannose transport system permease protein